MGSLVKSHFSKAHSVSPADVYHVTIMPCIDKRVEASRDEFQDSLTSVRDVDLVLTTSDFLELLQQRDVVLRSFEVAALPTQYTSLESEKVRRCWASSNFQFFETQGPSGGFMEFIFKEAVGRLYGVSLEAVDYHVNKPNYKELQWEVTITFVPKYLFSQVDGKVVLKFVSAYGFRNIQSVIKSLKQGNCDFDYIEFMACPGACTKGGGQILTPESTNEVLSSFRIVVNSSG